MKLLNNTVLAMALIAVSSAQSYAVENSAIKAIATPSAKIEKADTSGVKVTADMPEWTVMVFINAKNNLEGAGMADVNEMEIIGSRPKINVLAELGRIKGFDSSDGDWTGARRYYIMSDFRPISGSQQAMQTAYQVAMSKINSPILLEDRNADMGDYRRVISFVQWAKQNYPAKRYALILWNHGSGWMDPKPQPKPGTPSRGIAFDDETGNFIRTAQIVEILKAVGGVDVLGTDACVMQQFEIAYAVRNYAKVYVASEENEPGMGYDYTGFLGRLVTSPAVAPDVFGTMIVDSYIEFYSRYYSQIKQDATMSAIRLSVLPHMRVILDKWCDTAVKTTDFAALARARNEVIRFAQFGPQDPQRILTIYGDLGQFISLVNKYTRDPALKQAGDAVLAEVSKAVIKKGGVGSAAINKPFSLTSGMGISIPRVKTTITDAQLMPMFESAYSTLNFARYSKWDAFYTWMAANVK